MKTLRAWLKPFSVLSGWGNFRRIRSLVLSLVTFGSLLVGPSVLLGAPFEKVIQFTQPDGAVIDLWGKGDEFYAVFETLDALCEWCELNATVFADAKVSRQQWKVMLEKDEVYHQEGNNIFL